MENFYSMIKSEVVEVIEKKSKFIAYIFSVQSVEQAEEKRREIKSKFYDARHHCMAYRVWENGTLQEKASDDGEPAGTAGSPILSILQRQELYNNIIIVVRYFGGTLLGTGGLVKAYSEATIKVIEKSQKVKFCEGIEYELKIEYNDLENFKNYCKKQDINILNLEYLEVVICKIEIEKRKKESLLGDIQAKRINIKEIKVLSEKFIQKSVKN